MIPKNNQTNLKLYLKNAFSPRVLTGIIACFCVLLTETAGTAYDILFRGLKGCQDAYYFNISLHFGFFIWAAPLICAFAGAGTYCDVYESGFHKRVAVSCGVKPLRRAVWYSGTLSGGMALAGGMLAFVIFQMCVFEPCRESSILASVDAWHPILSKSNGGLLYMLSHVGLAFVFGAIWAGVGIAVSMVYPNRYVSSFAPFIICYCTALILPAELQPLEMLVQMKWYDMSFAWLFTYQGIIYGLSYCAFCQSIKRECIN